MNDLRLMLDLNSEQDNLYIKTGKNCKAMYNIDGFNSPDEDERVNSFSDVPEVITLEADGKNVLSSISEIDSENLLATNIITFEENEICIYEFENKKVSNLKKVEDGLYEIPLKDSSTMENDQAADILADQFYELEYDETQHDFPLSTNRLFIFLFTEKEKLYRSSILSNRDYEGFIGKINQFKEKYNVEFEQSEGTELILSTLYLMREYLNQDWEEIRGLLEKS
ncbi:hypothetical protein [Salinicoccus sp. HZC-1]|uniref:hypothetical protein n=1 Tax=Salinicoccus sp. HZC-1 TaxID=3385497 RepID=UPI00398ADB57